MDDRIALAIWRLSHGAQSGDVCAGALLADYARLKQLAGEPLPWLLLAYAPTGYEQTQRNEILRDTCPRFGVDDGPDVMEDV